MQLSFVRVNFSESIEVRDGMRNAKKRISMLECWD